MHSAAAGTPKRKQYHSASFLSWSWIRGLLCLAQAMLVLSGCTAFKGYPERSTDPSTDLLQLRPDIEANQITACLKETTDAAALTCRNRIIAARMYAIDIQFSEFEESLFQQTRSSGFAATVATLGLTSAAAVAGGTASQILSGAAAFIIGTREAFQKEVLAERTLVAIHMAMRAGRTRVAVRLRDGLRSPLSEYPLALGLADLNAYYDAGTILGSLIGITEAVGAEEQRAQQDLLVVSTIARTEAATFLQGLIAAPGRDVSRVRDIQNRIRAEMDKQGVPSDISVSDFVRRPDPEFEQQRQAVARALGWKSIGRS
jgi:hypothetical protein